MALNERSSTLHEIVDNHDVSSLGLALLDAHNSLLIVPDFGTDDLRAPRVAEHLMEAFPCTFVRIRDGDEFRVRELSKSRLEQRHAGQEERQHRVSKVESLLQRVNVEDDQRGWTAARERHIREHSREARGRGDVSFVFDALECARREVRQHERKAPDEHPRERVNYRELLENDIRVME